MGTIKEKFLQAYADIPEDLRSEIIVVIDEKSYTWNTSFFEVKKDSELADKILNSLENIGII